MTVLANYGTEYSIIQLVSSICKDNFKNYLTYVNFLFQPTIIQRAMGFKISVTQNHASEKRNKIPLRALCVFIFFNVLKQLFS